MNDLTLAEVVRRIAADRWPTFDLDGIDDDALVALARKHPGAITHLLRHPPVAFAA